MLVQDRIGTYMKGTKELNSEVQNVDVLVIGSGMGGLTTASLLSKNGIKTYLAEKNDFVGGYFSFFIEDNSIFDYAVSYALSFDENGASRQLILDIGVDDKIDIIKLNHLDQYVFENKKIYSMPNNCYTYKEQLSCLFSEESENINLFFDWLKEYSDGLKTKRYNNFIIKNFLKDYEPFIRKYFKNQALINILSMRIQADPSSLFIMGGFLNECLQGGMYYVKGGFGGLALKIAQTVCENGSLVGVNKTVTALEYIKSIQKYKAIFSTGETLYTKYIVCNTSPNNIINLLDRNEDMSLQIEKLKKKFISRKIGHSSINIYLKVKDIDLSSWNCGRIYIIPSELSDFDVFRYYEKIEAGEYITNHILKVHIPSNYDKSICGSNESILRIETDMCIDYFEELMNNSTIDFLEKERKRILQYVLQKLDSNINAEISKHIIYSRIITPEQFREITLNERGSGTGWAHTVNNYFKNIFTTKTDIEHCYIVGQWGELGSGLRQLILSGRKAAEDIIKNLSE